MYDWQTDEEMSWADEKPGPANSARRRWLWLAISLALLIAGGPHLLADQPARRRHHCPPAG